MESSTWPTEVWAVEYTTMENKRAVAIMNEDEARLWMENLIRNSDANPVLLRSDANFQPAPEIQERLVPR